MVGKEGTDSSFPIDTLTLTLTFHDPEQSLLYQLHWLDTQSNAISDMQSGLWDSIGLGNDLIDP